MGERDYFSFGYIEFDKVLNYLVEMYSLNLYVMVRVVEREVFYKDVYLS